MTVALERREQSLFGSYREHEIATILCVSTIKFLALAKPTGFKFFGYLNSGSGLGCYDVCSAWFFYYNTRYI